LFSIQAKDDKTASSEHKSLPNAPRKLSSGAMKGAQGISANYFTDQSKSSEISDFHI
jgi:hypothetical protein